MLNKVKLYCSDLSNILNYNCCSISLLPLMSSKHTKLSIRAVNIINSSSKTILSFKSDLKINVKVREEEKVNPSFLEENAYYDVFQNILTYV